MQKNISLASFLEEHKRGSGEGEGRKGESEGEREGGRGGKGGEREGLKERERKRVRRSKGWGRDGNYLACEPSFSPNMALSNSDFI